MGKYFQAECYKVFRRKYLYLTLLITLLGVGLLLGGSWFTYSHGNPYITFQSMANMVALILFVGIYATLMTSDMVFSDQYKWTTLKNEVSYGLSRTTIYTGKLLVSFVISILACALLLGTYIGGSWILFPHGEGDGQSWALLGYCLAGALPIWLGALSVVISCFFNVRSNTAATFAALGILAFLPNVFQVMGLLVNPVFTVVYQYMPTVILDSLPSHVGNWSYVGVAWLVGIGWFLGALVIGLVGFHKREIR